MYSSITVIGLGTLGGYLAKSLADLETMESLVLIDYDVVENKNVRNSVYTRKDVGRLKVDALHDKIKQDNEKINLELIDLKYIEGRTKIPTTDLVIDCRDFIYDRGNIIDARMYISSRYLIIDCRKYVENKTHYEGRYLHLLTKTDLRNAAFNASLFIFNGLINEIITKGTIYKIELDYLNRITAEELNEPKNKVDMIFDKNHGVDKLMNLTDHVYPIIEENKKDSLVVCIGDRDNPSVIREVPKNKMKTTNDVVSELTSAIDLPINFNYFIVAPVRYKNKYIIELLPETGAA